MLLALGLRVVWLYPVSLPIARFDGQMMGTPGLGYPELPRLGTRGTRGKDRLREARWLFLGEPTIDGSVEELLRLVWEQRTVWHLVHLIDLDRSTQHRRA